MERRCEHCGSPFRPNAVQQRYCSSKCYINAKAMRRYHRRKRTPQFIRAAERRRQYAKRWRQEKKEQGICPRCTGPNDGVEIGVSICSTCYARMKGG